MNRYKPVGLDGKPFHYEKPDTAQIKRQSVEWQEMKERSAGISGTNLSIFLPKNIFDMLQDAAQQTGVNRSRIIAAAIEDFIEKYSK